MVKLTWILFLALVLYRLLLGRWPLSGWLNPEPGDLRNARALLGLGRRASPDDIRAAHRQLLASVHPDRGGSAEQVHEADAARDLLLADAAKRRKQRV